MFIVIEGADGSGKGTQSKLLLNRLKKEKYKVSFFDFPQYEKTFFGKIVGQMLSGKFGNLQNIDPHIASIIYALDRWQASKPIKKDLEKNKIVLANRFTLSNIAHQTARLSENKRKDFVKFINQLENKILDIPIPQFYIYLSVPTNISQDLILKKAKRKYLSGKKMDALEIDLYHQAQASKVYQDYAIKNPKKIITINCVKNGKIKTQEEIHELIYKSLLKSLQKE